MDPLTQGQRPPREPFDPDEPTYRCPDCLDHGYVRTKPAMVRSQYSGKMIPAGGATVAWFCSCEVGRKAHAGHWFDKVYPMRGDHRVEDHAGKARLQEYLAAHPFERSWLPGAVDLLRERHEAARKRKLNAVTD